ncbi:restriction endonuclease subunit S [Streptomyces sp. BRA346]|uniref:restriction endonuclease subunit S n=1 Tax=Streptomyces sp. BRA346 TaxID=2878199 RepID=UPI0040627C11
MSGVGGELPKGWVWVRLDEIADVQGGIQKQQKRRPIANKYPFLRVANVTSAGLELSDVHEIELFEGEIERFALRTGDLLVVEGNGSISQLGRAARWRGEIEACVHQNHLIRVRPTSAISDRFLELLWNSPVISEQIRRVAASTSGLHTLSTFKIKQVNIPLPPLSEQLRIVTALEQQLSRLDAATQSVAKAVRSGFALIDTVKRKTVSGLSLSSPRARLGDVLREPLRNGHSARAATDGTVRTLTLTAVTQGKFDETHTKLTAPDPHRVSNLWLEPGDIFIQRSNTPDLVGTSALYDGPSNWAIYPDLLIRVRTDERLDSRFAQLVLSAPQTRQYFRASAKGLAGSMPKIDQETILNTPLPLPDIETQRRVVKDVAHTVEQVQRAVSVAESSEGKSAALRRSLLAEAFAGRLAPQDPDDEPADELLARIRAEREAAAPKKRRTRRAPAQRKATHDEPPPAPAATATTPLTGEQPTLDLEFPS